MPLLPQSPQLAVEEFRALRATIRERGTLRLAASLLTFAAWAGLALLAPLPRLSPGVVLVPLVALWAGFEVILATHIGVERIGRFLQLHYESDDTGLPHWERTAMALGQQPGAATGSDPLLVRLFTLATLLNLLPLIPTGSEVARSAIVIIPLAIVIVLHVTFLIRLGQARRFARSQRARDLELFKRLP